MEISRFSLPELEQLNTPDGRFYVTPSGKKYPSVTTILGKLPSPELDAWIERVGPEEAKRVGNKAATRGTRVHECCENYVLGKKNKFNMFESDVSDLFSNLKPYLDKFEVVYALEDRVYSDILRVAGTIDCVAMIDGKIYLVDFKTSARFKSINEIDSYFLQTSAYALAFWERTKMIVPNIKILITTEEHGVLEYNSKVSDWIGKFKSFRNTIDL